MKILVLNNRYPSKKNPFVASYVKTIVDGLQALGHTVEILVDRGNSSGKLGQIKDLLNYHLKVMAYPRLRDFDILFLNHFQLYWPMLKRRVGVEQKIVVHWHGSELRSARFKKIEEWKKDRILLKASHIFPSNYFKNRVLAEWPSLTNTYVLPSGGVDTAIFYGSKKSVRDGLVIGFASHLQKAKGVDFLKKLVEDPRFVKEIGEAKIIWKAINYGDPSGEHTAYLKKAGAEIVPPMKKNEMPGFYQSLDILLFPTRDESLGLVPIEGMACGVPVVCPDALACPEYCIPGLSGELFKYDDYNKFREAAIRTFKNIDRYNPTLIVEQKYSRERVQKQYAEILEKMQA